MEFNNIFLRGAIKASFFCIYNKIKKIGNNKSISMYQKNIENIKVIPLHQKNFTKF